MSPVTPTTPRNHEAAHSTVVLPGVDLQKFKDIKAAVGVFNPEKDMDLSAWIECFEWACHTHKLGYSQMSGIVGTFLKGAASLVYQSIPTHTRRDWTTLKTVLLHIYQKTRVNNPPYQETRPAYDPFPP